MRTLAAALLALPLAACQPSDTGTHPAPRAFVPVAALGGATDELASLRTTDNEARRATLVALLEARGLEPTLQAFPNDGRPGREQRTTGHNVIVDIGDGTHDIIIGAHYDAVPVGEGMVDNAASVVVLLHAATALRGMHTSHRIRVVFFDMEEIGLVGSRHFADSLDPERVHAVINLDVNGYGDTVFYGHTAHQHTGLYDALAETCVAQRISCIDFPVYPPSDNLSFQHAGIPNISLSVLPRAEVHQLWLMMNQREHSGLAEGFLPGVFLTIHTQGDTLVRIEPEAMALSYNALMGLLAGLDTR